jgi:sarcosine oxidase delta subunit
MSFYLPCPNCGPREVNEFRYGGEVAVGPHNLPGPQTERWYHRLGCRRWLVAVRDVRTNAVSETRLLDGAAP